MPSRRRYLAAATMVLALAGCSAAPAVRPARVGPVPSATATRALSGAQLRIAVAECAEQIELGTASGHDYTRAVLGARLHSHALPRPCWPLSLGQILTAAREALKSSG